MFSSWLIVEVAMSDISLGLHENNSFKIVTKTQSSLWIVLVEHRCYLYDPTRSIDIDLNQLLNGSGAIPFLHEIFIYLN